MSNISYEEKKQSYNQSATVSEVEKPFTCPICNAAFKCEKNLRIHGQFSHEIEKLTDEPTIQVLSNISHNNLHPWRWTGEAHNMSDLSYKENTLENYLDCKFCQIFLKKTHNFWKNL